jgi:hypothetical protein
MDHDKRQKEGIHEIKRQSTNCPAISWHSSVAFRTVILNHVLQCELVELLKKQGVSPAISSLLVFTWD